MRDAILTVPDEALIEAFKADPDSTYLVSFPRTGSLWLRRVIEAYFERPWFSLVFHTHDFDLDTKRRDVIYLYRNPVDTIYSWLCFNQESPENEERVLHWATRYAHHVAHWLIEEDFTVHKTVVRYEALRHDALDEFEKVIRHFGNDCDRERLEICIAKWTKEEMKRNTPPDSRFVILEPEYETERRRFREQQARPVWDAIGHLSKSRYGSKDTLFGLFSPVDRKKSGEWM